MNIDELRSFLITIKDKSLKQITIHKLYPNIEQAIIDLTNYFPEYFSFNERKLAIIYGFNNVPRCCICNNELRNNQIRHKCCSAKCARKLSANNGIPISIDEYNKKFPNDIIKYGSSNLSKYEKYKITLKKNYGIINIFQNKSVIDKIKQTIKANKKIDVDWCQSKEFKEKSLDSYGRWPTQNKIKNFDEWNNNELLVNKIKNLDYNIDEIANYFNVNVSSIYNKVRSNNLVWKHTFGSRGEYQILQFIKSINPTIKVDINKRNIIAPKELDLYFPENKLAIEFNGIYWHSQTKDKMYHFNKSKACQEKGIRLMHIWEDQWNDKRIRPILEDIIKSAIGKLENRIYARKCIVKEIDNKLYKEFVEKNHIQGYRPAKIKLGLFYNDELVQIASFNKSLDKYCEYEWIRGCPASNNVVIGGTSKLLQYFINNYKPISILCYSDFNLFDGKGYNECGFEFKHYTKFDKWYYDIKQQKRINRSPYRYKEYKELVKQNKLIECYGSGSLRWELKYK